MIRRVGIALSADTLVAVPLDVLGRARAGTPAWTRALDRPGAAEVGEALRELREELRAPRLAAHVALLPPLAMVRLVPLPRLDAAEQRRVLERDSGRYFLTGGAPQVVGAVRLAAVRGAAPVLAATAPAQVVEAVLEGAAAAGCAVSAIVPAAACWAAAVPPAARARGVVVAAPEEEVQLLALAGGKIARVRRVPHGRAAADALAALRAELGEGAAVVLLAADDERDALAGALGLGANGPATVNWGSRPDVAAAAFAARAAGPELAPARVHDARARTWRRATAAMTAGAAAMLALAAALELWGARRELGAVRAERAAIAAPVGRAMRERDALLAVEGRLATLDRLERTAPQWSAAIATVATVLPRDAHLTAFRGSADSLALEGIARQAAGVFDAVRRAPGVVAVRADAPIRQEVQADGAAIERFTLAARLGAGAAAAAPRRGHP